MLACFGPASTTVLYKTLPCILDIASADLSGLVATRYDETLAAGAIAALDAPDPQALQPLNVRALECHTLILFF